MLWVALFQGSAPRRLLPMTFVLRRSEVCIESLAQPNENTCTDTGTLVTPPGSATSIAPV